MRVVDDGAGMAVGAVAVLTALGMWNKYGRKGSRDIDLDAIVSRVTGTPPPLAGRVQAQAQPQGVYQLANTIGTSDKVWTGWVEPQNPSRRGGPWIFKASWGRRGTKGQSGNWFFPSYAAAVARLEQKVGEKIGKGYTYR